MTTAPPSPKRRHILSSINPERPPITEDKSKSPEATASLPREPSLHYDADGNGDMERPPEQAHPKKTSKFRFKSKHSSSHREEDRDRHRGRVRDRDRDRVRDLAEDDGDGDQEHNDSSSTQRRHHRHRRHREDHEDGEEHPPDDKDDSRHHHHRHKRRRHHRHRTPTRTRSPTPPNPYDPPPLSPDAAFRASLFDAMADDEGASYWEGVYGQPMHVYSRGSGNGSSQAPAGDLEQMTEEGYAAYVRQRMWEKTHEGLLEERARREARKQERAARETEARRLTREMEESLRRGEERRRRKGWRERWEGYLGAWAAWDNTTNNDNDGNDKDGGDGRRHPLENDTSMAWPVESGRRADVRGGGDGEDGSGSKKTDAVREFFVRGLIEAQEKEKEVGEASRDSEAPNLAARLKDERVRWHPDKVQQRLGGRVDDGLMRDVTAVFQAVDKLWSDMRAKKDP